MTIVFHGHDMSGTTAQRPTNAEAGQPYFNTTTGKLEVYSGSAWVGGETKGRNWYVDTANGDDTNDGGGWGAAFATMDAAFDALDSGDTVLFTGNVREQLTAPAQKFDVTIVGVGNRPRHADATPAGGDYAASTWKAPASPAATTPLLKLQQQGWRLINILFVGHTDAACVQLFRDGGEGNAERDASHTEILGCRFAGQKYGVQDSGGCANVKISGCTFQQFDASGDIALYSVTGAGIGTKWGWEITNNRFLANHTDFDMDLSNAQIVGNYFHHVALGVTNTVAIDETGGAENLVARNFMFCASDEAAVVNARFVKAASSIWGPNYYSDKEEYAEPAE